VRSKIFTIAKQMKLDKHTGEEQHRYADIQGTIFMPTTTPRQKVSQVKLFGGSYVEVVLVGDTFDDSFVEAMKYCLQEDRTFVHPFDDPLVVAGQGTVGLEILNDLEELADFVFAGIGGGGLVAGIGTYVKGVSPATKIIGVEPSGAPSMKAALDLYRDRIAGKNVVCVISGGNNDIDRMQEIKERSLLHAA